MRRVSSFRRGLRHLWIGTLGTALAAGAAWAADPEARGLELARLAEKSNEGFAGERAGLTLTLINAHGEQTQRRMTIEILEVPGEGPRSRIAIDWPPDVRGTKLLTHSRKAAEDQQWLYLPVLKQVRRIAAGDRSGAFMGSEFVYEDFAGQAVEKFTYRYLDDVKTDGRDCWRLERAPKDKSSLYRRQVVFLDREYLAPLRIEYFDRRDTLLKVATFTGYRKLGRFWRFDQVRMENRQTRKSSILGAKERQVGLALAAGRFASTVLEE
jgi:hypothetical protein